MVLLTWHLKNRTSKYRLSHIPNSVYNIVTKHGWYKLVLGIIDPLLGVAGGLRNMCKRRAKEVQKIGFVCISLRYASRMFACEIWLIGCVNFECEGNLRIWNLQYYIRMDSFRKPKISLI